MLVMAKRSVETPQFDEQDSEFIKCAELAHVELLDMLFLPNERGKLKSLQDWISKYRKVSFLDDMERAEVTLNTLIFGLNKRELLELGKFSHLLDEAGLIDLVLEFKSMNFAAEIKVSSQGARVIIEFDKKEMLGGWSQGKRRDKISGKMEGCGVQYREKSLKMIEIKLITKETIEVFSDSQLLYHEIPQPPKKVKIDKGLLGDLFGKIEYELVSVEPLREIRYGLFINGHQVGAEGSVEDLWERALREPIKRSWNNENDLIQDAFAGTIESENLRSEKTQVIRLEEEGKRDEMKKEVDAAVKEQVRRIMEDLESRGSNDGGWSGNERVYPDNNGGYHIYRGNTHLRAYPDGFGGFHIKKA